MLMKKTLTLAIALAATLSLQAQNRSDLPGLSTIISSQPEGTLHKDVNHYFEGCYVYPSDGAIYDYFADGCVADLVEADDGSLYIKNPFGFFSVDDAEVWVKAVKAADGNGYEVHLPQAVYDNQGGEDPILYAWRYVKDGSNNYAKVDANSQVGASSSRATRWSRWETQRPSSDWAPPTASSTAMATPWRSIASRQQRRRPRLRPRPWRTR